MKNSSFKIGLRLAVFQLGLLLCQNLLATQPGFSFTPTAVSNTYIGPITMQITNLPTGDTVVIQKFGDANANGVIDAGDQLVQQFNLTDGQAGMVIGGITNINVPGDLNSTTGAITATLNFPGGDFTQSIIAKYGFILSSPVGHFTPITNFFTVTNFPYAQTITGNVVSNGTSTVIPYAGVILFPAPRPGHDLGNPVAGTVANNLGVYTIQVPSGTYVPLTFKSNYVASYLAAPVVTLTNTQTVTTNLTMTVATASISGKVVDANNSSIVLPGLFVPANNSSYFITSGSSDTNGNFTIGVTSGQWKISGNPDGLALHGYVAYDDGTNVTAGTANFVGGFYKATALFYGTVKDNLGNPLAGVAIEARDNNNSEFDNDGYSDANGNYVAGAVGGLGSGDPWQVDVDHAPANYIFSQSALNQNGGTNMTVGKVVLQNFTGILATNYITGNVQFNGTNVVGVGVSASAQIGGVDYNTDNADTDGNGNYSLTVANGTNWSVSVSCQGGDNSLDNILGNGNYECPDNQNITINNNNGTANFTIQPCNGVQITTTSPLPDGQVGSSYYNQLQASSCSDNGFTWSLNDPADFPPGLAFDQQGEIFNTPSAGGTYNFSVHVDDNNGHSTDQSFSLYIAGASSPLQITTSSLPNGTNTTFYSQTLQASGGTPPYSWAVAYYSVGPPPNLNLDTNGVLSGTLATNGSFSFDVAVTDGAETTVYQTLSLYVVNPPLPPLVITNVSLPNGNVGASYSAQLGATGGQPPYGSWQLTGTSLPLPTGLSLDYTTGLISGTPTTNKVSTFKVQMMDANFTPTNKILSITINPKPVLSLPNWLTNQFQMRLTGGSNQNYTIQVSTNLSSPNWTTLFITNNAATNSFIVVDPNATNKQRFYRAVVGP